MTGSKTIFSPFIINFCIQFPHQKKIQKEYLRYKAITDNQSKIPIVLKYLPRLADMDKDYSALTRELEDKAKLLQTYMTFIVMDNTLEKVKIAAKSLINYYSEKKSLWLMIVIFVFQVSCRLYLYVMIRRLLEIWIVVM
jgi:conjugal transfer ATP-binding protein TraC